MNQTVVSLLLTLFTLICGGFGMYAMYHAFKPYKKGDKFFEDIAGTDFFLFDFFISVILWLIKKWFPERFYIKVYRVIAFLFGLFMLSLFGVIWFVVLS